MVLPLGVAGPLPSPLLLLLLIWAGMTLALPNSPRIHGRQEGTSSTATTTTTTTSSSATSSSTTSPATAGESAPGSQNLSTGLIVPLASVLGAAVLFAFLIKYRLQILKLFGRNRTSGPADSANNPVTAEVLAGARSGRSAAPTTAAAPGTTNRATRRRRSRGAALRRTESGRSVKTLPEYTKDAGDEELVLVRQRSGSMSDGTYSDEMEHGQEDDAVGDEEAQIHGRRDHSSTPIGRSTENTGEAAISDSINDRNATGGIGDTSSVPLSEHTRTPSTTRRTWGEAPTYLEAMSSPNPDEIPSPPSSADVPAPRRNTSNSAAGNAATAAGETLRRTASGIRDLLSRPFGPTAFRAPSNSTATQMLQIGSGHGGHGGAGGRSRAESQSSLLHPTTSRFSTFSATPSASGASSTYNSPWASTASLLISPPLPNSARRASFVGEEMPKSGLSEQQMRFLASSEAVDLVGVRLDEPSGVTPKRRRGSSSAPRLLAPGAGNGTGGEGSITPGSRTRSRASSFGWAELSGGSGGEIEEMGESSRLGQGQGDLERPPPSWEEVDGERRRNEAAGRKDLAKPITREEMASTSEEAGSGMDTQSHGEGISAEEQGSATTYAERENAMSTPPPPPPVTNRPTAPGLAIPSHLALQVQIEPPTPISRPSSGIA